MHIRIYIFALITAAWANQSVILSDVDSCQILLRQNSMLGENETVRALDGFVGIGWDDLQNRATIPVLKSTYKNCKRAQDGTFFVPDDILVVPVLKTNLDRMANVYHHFTEYVNNVENTINAGGGLHYGAFGVSGSFSSTHQEVKTNFFQQNSVMLHSRMIYHAYTLIINGNAEVNDMFAARLTQVINAIERNSKPLAKYLTELIIRDYGTHIVFKADVGAIIEQETYVASQATNSSSTSIDALKASASVSFLSLGNAKIDAAHSVTEKDKEFLSTMTHHSRIRTRGGPSVPRLSDGKGIFQIDELVSFSNEGIPIDTIITTANLPMFGADKIYILQELIRNASKEYYERNTIRGCTDISSPNFNYQANVDDNSCKKPSMNFSFNGVFQKCTPVNSLYEDFSVTATPGWRCDGLSQVNPMTKDFTCQENYEPVLISSILHQFPDRVEQRSYKKCYFYWFTVKCDTIYYSVVNKDHVQIESYWCRAKPNVKIPPNTGAMFGGIYTTNVANVFTGSKSCPGSYVGYHLYSDVTVCVSYDYQLDEKYAIPFNGFFSCQSPKKKCDDGYTQHLVEIFDRCAVFYCVAPDAYLSFEHAVIKRPPYTNATLAISDYPEDTILAFFKKEEVVKMPVINVVKQHMNEFQQKNGKSNSGITVVTANDVQGVVHDYMEKAGEKILKLIQKYPNKTWKEIQDIVDNQGSSSFSISSISGHIVLGIVAAVIVVVCIVGLVTIAVQKYRRGQQFQPDILHNE